MSEFTQAAVCIPPTHPLVKQVPPLPSTTRGNNSVISTHPKDPDLLIYCSGKSVVVRSISDPYGPKSFVYRGHNSDVRVAKFSPSGHYVASADDSGKLRVWAWSGEDKKSKLEIQALGGGIRDLEWDGESKKIVVAGDGGSGSHLRCMVWDSGNNAGEFVGHNKRCVSVGYRQSRPFRIASGGEDFKTVFYAGPPFKRESESQIHSNYVNVVRYSPDGDFVATASSDKSVAIYDGKTGSHIKSLSNLHAGSIYGLAWSPDGHRLFTASADKTCKLLEAPSGDVLGTWTVGDHLGSMMVGAAWGTSPVGLCLDGRILVFDENDFAAPKATISGHQGAIVCLSQASGGGLVTGGADGTVSIWGVDSSCDRVTGGASAGVNAAVHTGQVTTVDVAGDFILSAGWDDTLRTTQGTSAAGAAGIGGQPKCSGGNGEVVVVATGDALTAVVNGEIKSKLEISYKALSIAVSPDGSTVAVGADNNKIYVYSFSGGDLAEVSQVTGHSGAVNSLAFSSSGDKLAAGDVKEVRVWTVADWSPLIKGRWQFHTSAIKGVAWSPDGDYIVSVGGDENMFVWCLAKKMKRLNYKFVHKGGAVAVEWQMGGNIVTAGADGVICVWDVKADMEAKFK